MRLKIFVFLLTFALACTLSNCVLLKDILLPPTDYGNKDVFKGMKPKIILFPFTVISKVDGHWETTGYYSEKEISIYLFVSMRRNCTLLYPDTINYFWGQDTTNKELQLMAKFINKLKLSVFSNPDSVQKWSANLERDSLVDSSAYFYMPLGIEIENDHAVSGSFFTIIANTRGKILFVREIDYNPIMWSEDYRSFVRDTRRKRLLCD